MKPPNPLQAKIRGWGKCGGLGVGKSGWVALRGQGVAIRPCNPVHDASRTGRRPRRDRLRLPRPTVGSLPVASGMDRIVGPRRKTLECRRGKRNWPARRLEEEGGRAAPGIAGPRECRVPCWPMAVPGDGPAGSRRGMPETAPATVCVRDFRGHCPRTALAVRAVVGPARRAPVTGTRKPGCPLPALSW